MGVVTSDGLWEKTVVIALLVLAGVAANAVAGIINFDTSSNSNWTVTGGGAVAAPAFYLALPQIAITSNSLESGQFAAGGNLSQFNGAWYADFHFTLPANATDVSLTFTNLFGDDRTVLQLNGNNIGDSYAHGNDLAPPLVGPGVMRFPSQSSDQPYIFTGITAGTATTGFLIGANDLRLVVTTPIQIASRLPR